MLSSLPSCAERHITCPATEEPKLDGFRAVAYNEGGGCRLVSRNRNAFKTFEPLAQAIGQELSGRSAILDGEIASRARRTASSTTDAAARCPVTRGAVPSKSGTACHSGSESSGDTIPQLHQEKQQRRFPP